MIKSSLDSVKYPFPETMSYEAVRQACEMSGANLPLPLCAYEIDHIGYALWDLLSVCSGRPVDYLYNCLRTGGFRKLSEESEKLLFQLRDNNRNLYVMIMELDELSRTPGVEQCSATEDLDKDFVVLYNTICQKLTKESTMRNYYETNFKSRFNYSLDTAANIVRYEQEYKDRLLKLVEDYNDQMVQAKELGVPELVESVEAEFESGKESLRQLYQSIMDSFQGNPAVLNKIEQDLNQFNEQVLSGLK